MSNYSAVTAVVGCPVVHHDVTLSRARFFEHDILLSESAPTCSNLHVCLSNYADIQNITECLLHSATRYLRPEDGPH
jgi:hypothetical protein